MIKSNNSKDFRHERGGRSIVALKNQKRIICGDPPLGDPPGRCMPLVPFDCSFFVVIVRLGRMLARAGSVALRRAPKHRNQRRDPLKLLASTPKRSFFWSNGSKTEPELVGADKHTVERFTPPDPRKKVKLVPETPSLSDPFPGVPDANLSISMVAPKTRITTLSNGVRVASEENFSQMSVVGLYVNTGTRFETPEEYGSSFMLERLSFKVRAFGSALSYKLFEK